MPKNEAVDQSPDQFAAAIPQGLQAPPATTEETAKRETKMSKEFPDDYATITITITGGVRGGMTFNPKDYPEAIQAKFPSFGLGHKLGDATSGKSGTEAEDAIMRVHEAMLNGEWAVKGVAAPRVSLKEISNNVNKLSGEAREAAIAALAAVGITIPGLTTATGQ